MYNFPTGMLRCADIPVGLYENLNHEFPTGMLRCADIPVGLYENFDH
jgi:hypothetical protein